MIIDPQNGGNEKLIVVVIAGIALSVIMSNITVKLFKLDKEAR